MINSKQIEIHEIMNEIEINLLMLDDESFNNVVDEYKKLKNAYTESLSNMNTDITLSLSVILDQLNEFNNNLCTNYNIKGTACYAA